MKEKFLLAIINRCKDKLNTKPFNREVYDLGFEAYVILLTPDAIDEQSQAHGEGVLKR